MRGLGEPLEVPSSAALSVTCMWVRANRAHGQASNQKAKGQGQAGIVWGEAARQGFGLGVRTCLGRFAAAEGQKQVLEEDGKTARSPHPSSPEKAAQGQGEFLRLSGWGWIDVWV